MIKYNTIIWCSDISADTGEGILARKFLDKYFFYKKNFNIKVKTLEKEFLLNNKKITKNIKFKNNFFHKYIGPLFGVFYLILNSKKREIAYINYLPLWNFLLFLLLPKKTILGPITGGRYTGKVTGINIFIRKYIFHLFCKLSLIIINKKFNKVIYSTKLLEIYYKKYTKKKKNILFDFVFVFFSKKKKKRIKKKYDIIFYNRNHVTKKTKEFDNLINLLSEKFLICVIGDYYDNKKVINFGRVSRDKVHDLLLKSKIALNSAENLFSLFAIDAINSGTIVMYQSDIDINYRVNSKYFFPIKSDDYFLSFKLISSLLQKNNKILDKKFELFVNKKKNAINNFLLDYFS